MASSDEAQPGTADEDPARFVWTIGQGWGQGDKPKPLLIVLPETVARYWLPRRKVLECTTWGQVRALGPEIHAEVLGMAGYGTFDEYTANFKIVGEAPGLEPGPVAEAERLLRSLGEVFSDDDPFAPYDDAGAIADHDWPPSIYSLLAESVPPAILRDFATTWMTVLNGPFASIDADRRDDVLTALADAGHQLVEAAWVADLIDF